MKLSEAIATVAPPPPRAHKRCTVAFIYDQLPAEEAAALTELLTAKVPTLNPDAPVTFVWPHRSIVDLLFDAGFVVQEAAIARHRGKRCICDAR